MDRVCIPSSRQRIIRGPSKQQQWTPLAARKETGLHARSERESPARRPIASPAPERDLAATRRFIKGCVASLTAWDVPRASGEVLAKHRDPEIAAVPRPPPPLQEDATLSHGKCNGRPSDARTPHFARRAVPEGLACALIALYFSSRWRR